MVEQKLEEWKEVQLKVVVLGRNGKLRIVLGGSTISVDVVLVVFLIHDSPFAAQVPAWPGQFLSRAPAIDPHLHRLPVCTNITDDIIQLHHKKCQVLRFMYQHNIWRITSLKWCEDSTFARISLALSAQ